MSRSATCSERGRRWSPSGRSAVRTAVAALVVASVLAPVHAKVVLTREQALAQAFGAEADVVRATAFLSEDQLARVRERVGAGVRVGSALVPRYLARRDGELIGTAYLDTHRVRTLEETVFVVVATDGTIARVDVLTFAEPEDYLPRPGWFAQFVGRVLDDELAVKHGIHGITGATLSAAAVTDAVRRVLAIHGVLAEDAAR